MQFFTFPAKKRKKLHVESGEHAGLREASVPAGNGRLGRMKPKGTAGPLGAACEVG